MEEGSFQNKYGDANKGSSNIQFKKWFLISLCQNKFNNLYNLALAKQIL